VASRLTGAVLLLCFLFAGWFSVRAAQADLEYRENTLASLEKATALAPDNAVFRALLGENMESAGRDPKPELAETTRLSPLDSQNWIRLAFQEEVEGDYAAAEAHLRRAAEVDHKAPPRWALMNFYFRRNRDPEFWFWVTKALEMSQGDATAIFRLAWDRSESEREILSRIPKRKDLLTQYLHFLGASDRLDAAHDVAIQVAQTAFAPELPTLMSYCNHYAAVDSARAVAVWNILCQRKLIGYSPLHPEAGSILTNADFTIEPAQLGFDWRLKAVEDASVSQSENGAGIRVELGGNQPENCILMEQTIPLISGKTYVISWESGASGTDAVSGLVWDLSQGPSEPSSGAISGEPGSNSGLLAFRASAVSAQLRLRYRRPLGLVRARGAVTLRSLRAVRQP